MAEQMTCSILTPDGAVFDGPVKSVTVPGADGELGFLNGHAALISSLGAGSLRVKGTDGSVKEWFVAAGFVEVLNNKVAVLAGQIMPKDKVSLAEAKKELEALAGKSSKDVLPGELDPKVIAKAKIRFAGKN